MHALTSLDWTVLMAAVFTVAFFYSSVGHGGATGYLAALAVVGVAPSSAKAAVLIANIFVASIAFWRFYRAGLFDWKIFLSFAGGSIPFAFLGSKVHVSPHAYKIILGAVLSVAGIVLFLRSRWQTDDVEVKKCFLPLALLVGAFLGFLAGLTGIGGGVFLSPLLYVFRWVKPKTTGGIAAGFIIVNSISGLVGAGWEKLAHAGPLLLLTLPAVVGALLGTHLGSRRWSSVTFSRVLAGVLVFAGVKLLVEAAA